MAITENQKKIVLAELEMGKSLRAACQEADISEPTSFLRLLNSEPDLATQYARAREIGWSFLGEDLIEVSDDTSIPSDHRRIMVDTRKWMLSKMLPKIYGDRLDLNHSGSISKADALTEAELRAVIDAKTPPATDN